MHGSHWALNLTLFSEDVFQKIAGVLPSLIRVLIDSARG
jgi:hypothetical protein